MTRFNEVFSGAASLALAILPLFAIAGVAHLEALARAVGY